MDKTRDLTVILKENFFNYLQFIIQVPSNPEK